MLIAGRRRPGRLPPWPQADRWLFKFISTQVQQLKPNPTAVQNLAEWLYYGVGELDRAAAYSVPKWRPARSERTKHARHIWPPCASSLLFVELFRVHLHKAPLEEPRYIYNYHFPKK